jgi:glutaminase
MSTRPQSLDSAGASYVSTGRLPPPEQVKDLVAEAYECYKSNTDGQNSQVYPALARVPGHLFGVCEVGTNGAVFAIGDSDYKFTIMSVSKPTSLAARTASRPAPPPTSSPITVAWTPTGLSRTACLR